MLTEKEKMLRGKPYHAQDEQLVNERRLARDLLFRFNHLEPSEQEQRIALLRQLLGKTGKVILVEPPFHCDYGYNISVGENFYANFNLVILDCAPVTIGDNAFLAPNISIFTAGHPLHHEPRNRQLEYALSVKIGHNVWLGGNTVINPGVSVGDNSVIGSGSVVTRDIPSGVVAVGNPCRVMRAITEDDMRCYFRKLRFDGNGV